MPENKLHTARNSRNGGHHNLAQSSVNAALITVDESKDVALAQSDDSVAFGRLMLSCKPAVTAHIYKMVSNRQDAEDLTSETFIQAWQKIGSFHGDSKFSTWVHRIATNATINFLKKRNNRNAREINLDQLEDDNAPNANIVSNWSAISAPATNHAFREEAIAAIEAFETAKKTLTPAHRQVIELTATGHSVNEIAAISHTNIGTVRSRRFYASNQIQSLLQNPKISPVLCELRANEPQRYAKLMHMLSLNPKSDD